MLVRTFMHVYVFIHTYTHVCVQVCVCVCVCVCLRVCLKLYGRHVCVLSSCVDCIGASNCNECSEIGESTDFDCQWCPQLSRCTLGDLTVYYTIVYL